MSTQNDRDNYINRKIELDKLRAARGEKLKMLFKMQDDGLPIEELQAYSDTLKPYDVEILERAEELKTLTGSIDTSGVG